MINYEENGSAQTYEEVLKDLLNDKSVSYRLKHMLSELDKADPVDAEQEALLLLALNKKRIDEIEGSITGSLDNYKMSLGYL